MLIRTAKAVLTALLLTYCSIQVNSCGSGSSQVANGPETIESPFGQLEQHDQDRFSLAQEIRDTQSPAGVSAVVWGQLTQELASQIEGRAGQRIVSTAPSGEQNRLSDLVLIDGGPGISQLQWSYRNVGDYDLNSEVNVADLTPVGLFFGASSGDANWVEAMHADGDGNGEVNIGDVTPIGRNFHNQVAGYVVEGSYVGTGNWEELGRLELTAGSIDPEMSLSYQVEPASFAALRVSPFDVGGQQGSGGELEFAIHPFASELSVSPDYGNSMVDNEINASVGIHESIGTPISVMLVEFDDQGMEVGTVGTMLDDGGLASGDETAGDGIYSHAFSTNPPDERRSWYKARVKYDPGTGSLVGNSNSVSVTFLAALSLEHAQELLDFGSLVNARLMELSAGMSSADAATQLLEEIKDEPLVADVGFCGDTDGVWWITPDGIAFAVTVVEPGTLGGSGIAQSTDPAQNSYWPGASGSPTRQASAAVLSDKRVLCLSPFENDFDNLATDDDAELIAGLFMELDCPAYDVTWLEDDDCTVAEFRKMGEYGTLAISSHGDTFFFNGVAGEYTPLWGNWVTKWDEQVGIMTGESVDAASMLANEIDLKTGRLMINPATEKYAFTPGFVLHYCRNMPDSVVMLTACRSSYNLSMVDAFLQGGASVVFGFNDYAYARWVDDVTPELFERLLQGMDAKSAFIPNQLDTKHENTEGYRTFTVQAEFTMHSRKNVSYAVEGVPAYDVIDLRETTELTGGFCSARDMNQAGEIVGSAWQTQEFGSESRAFIWRNEISGMQLLPIEGYHASGAISINDSGDAVGWVDSVAGVGVFWHSSLWQSNELILLDEELKNLDPPLKLYNKDLRNYATGINKDGTIIGIANFFGPSSSGTFDTDGEFAYRYNRNTGIANKLIQPFDPADHEGLFTYASDINLNGYIVGETGYNSSPGPGVTTLAAFSNGDEMKVFPNPSNINGRANAVNDNGTSVGTINGNAAYWPGASMLELVEGFSESSALDVNNLGHIVGMMVIEGADGSVTDQHAAVWYSLSAPAIDLNCLIDPALGWHLREATAINDKGWIAGNGLIGSAYSSFLLIPKE